MSQKLANKLVESTVCRLRLTTEHREGRAEGDIKGENKAQLEIPYKSVEPDVGYDILNR